MVCLLNHICCAPTSDLITVNILLAFRKLLGFSISIPFTTFILIKYLRSLIFLDYIAAFSFCSCHMSSVVYRYQLFLCNKVFAFSGCADGCLGKGWVRNACMSRHFLCWDFGNGSHLVGGHFGRGVG